VQHLELDNRDVSVGRRNGNCISCSNKSDGYASLKYKDGKDGKMYITSGKTMIGKGMDARPASNTGQ
jgi:Zn/Cd-binding protein ZinT